jgi:hypothetical protein
MVASFQKPRSDCSESIVPLVIMDSGLADFARAPE